MKIVNTPEPPKGILGRKELLALGVGQVIGAGVVSLVGPAIAETGYSVWLVYFIAVLMGLLYSAPIIFLTSTVRLAGGRYSVAADFLGAAPAGYISISVLISTYTCASYPTAMGSYVNSIAPGISAQWAGIALWTVFFIINLFGVRAIARVQKYMTWPLIATLALFSIFGIVQLKNPVFDFSNPSFFANGTEGVFVAAMLLYSSTRGYYTNMNYGKDCKNATRDIPWSMMATVPIIAVLYCGVAIVAAGVLPLEQVAGQPLTMVAQSILPPVLFYVFMIGGPLFALFTTVNGTLANIPYAIAQSCKDGWLPKSFASVNGKGAHWKIVTVIYLAGLVPLLLNLDIATITSNMMLFSTCISMFDIIAYYRLPGKYPEAWKKSRLHVPDPVYYLIVSLSAALNIFMMIRSLMSLTVPLAAVSILLMALCGLYIVLRMKRTDMTVYTSVWVPSEETAEETNS